MSVQVIDTLKPKNNGSFPVVEAEDVAVSDELRLPEALGQKAEQTDLEELSSALTEKADASDISNLQAQIDNLITPVTQDAEVENARVGEDGTSYTTLKERLDAENGEVNGVLSDFIAENEIPYNLYNYNDPRIKTGGYYDSAGVYTPASGYYVSEPILVAGGVEYKVKKPYTISHATIVYVDDSGTVESHFSGTINSETIVFTPPKSGYISVNLGTSASYKEIVLARSAVYSSDLPYATTRSKLASLSNAASAIVNSDKRGCSLQNPADTRIESDKYIGENGTVSSSGYYISEPILVAGGVEYKADHPATLGNNAYYAITDSDGTIMRIKSGEIVSGILIFTPDDTGYVKINLGKTNIATLAPSDYYASATAYYSIEDIRDQLTEISEINFVTFEMSNNLTDFSKMSEGYLSSGTFVSDSNYLTSDYIEVDNTKSYTKYCTAAFLGSSAPKLNAYDGEKNYISTIEGTTETDDYYHYSNLPANCAYIRYTHGRKASQNAQTVFFGEGDTEPTKPFEPYAKYLESDVSVPAEQIIGNINKDNLYDKVWYVLGDSATHGDFNSIVQPPLDSGIYAGELPVYPFYIGNRTGMVVHNLGVNGATIATIPDQPSRYQFSKDGVYDEIVGDDADYITIWLGANDMWQNVPLGTIDSDDATTFYGAWNKLLSYYSQNYPNAKLGAVVSFWCTQEYAEAVKAVTKKYGVPALNLYDDDRLPVTVGSQRPDVAASVKAYRNAQWVVSPTNSHPSAKYHEIESYFIEEWLRSI